MHFATLLTSALLALSVSATPVHHEKRAIVTKWETHIITEIGTPVTKVVEAPIVYQTVTADPNVQTQQANVVYKTMTFGQEEVQKKYFTFTKYFGQQPKPAPTPAPAPVPEPVPEPAPVEQPAPVEPPKEVVVEQPKEQVVEPPKQEEAIQKPEEDIIEAPPQEEAMEKPADFDFPVTQPAQPSTNQPAAGTWQAAILAKHNELRARHNAPPLVWDTELEAFAQNHVNQCAFKHSASTPFGENLSGCTGEMTDPAGTIEIGWYNDELPHYNQGDGFSLKTGHLTQMIWKSTTKLGCALKLCNHLAESGWNVPSSVLTCSYDPAGNVRGQFSQQVSV